MLKSGLAKIPHSCPITVSFFCFWSLLATKFTKIPKNTKILRTLWLHFARHDGQDGKKQIENHTTKVTKIPKFKIRKYGINRTDDFENGIQDLT